jgi:hypothetical protein
LEGLVTVEQVSVLVDERELLVMRLNGIPRDPEDGRHRRVIVYASPTTGLRDLARRLRLAADRLDDQARRA